MTRTRRTIRTLVAAAATAASFGATGISPATAGAPPAANGNITHGFLVENGRFVTYDHPGAPDTTAAGTTAGTSLLGVDDRGEYLGGYGDLTTGFHFFVRDRRGHEHALPDPPGGGILDQYFDVNDEGDTIGVLSNAQGLATTGFLRTARGRYVPIDVPGSTLTGPLRITDRGQVAGVYVGADGVEHGFRWQHGRFTTIDVPGAADTIVEGISNDGRLVGSYTDSAGTSHGFVRDPHGRVTTLPDAPGSDPTAGGTQPSSVNDRGEVTGIVATAGGSSRAFLYEHGHYHLIDAPHAVYTRGIDINDAGEIVGDYATTPTTAPTS